jgi:predicted alpha/beta superfamily hydrolase
VKTLAALLAFAASASATAADLPATTVEPIGIGRAHTLTSAVLHERRLVNVVLPASYAKQPEKRYPVLYLIDGGVEQDLLHVSGAVHLGALWGRSAEAIIVGIETKDRRRELVGPTRDPELLRKYPTAGSSKAFRSFIRDEVKPLVESSYRTDGQDAVIGESLAGLFILETYLDEPTLFDAYAAIDPSLWWDKEALSRTAAAKVAGLDKPRPLYLALAREQAETPAAMARVTNALRGAVPRRCLAVRPDLFHSTIYQQLIPQALQFLLPPKEPAPAEFGFKIACGEGPQGGSAGEPGEATSDQVVR